MSEQHVPTMGQIRDGYVWLSGGDNPGAEQAAGDDFDTAIAAHDREVAAKALREAKALLSAETEGVGRTRTRKWPEPDRDIYTSAIDDAEEALSEMANEIEKGTHQ